ncbi:hypothetical protein F4677DRAFT_465880 [Hypoxylon crocopeplum]|nr:hypothetical protein F4677DRAFT_465880 [Hypoxylon crocopeplum]
MDKELHSEDLALEHLKKHIDKIGPDIYAIHVSDQGELIHRMTIPLACTIHLYRKSNARIVSRPYNAQSYKSSIGLVAFKYYFINQFISWVWNETNLWMRLPEHPNIVPFDKLVVDEVAGRFIGFTTVYIPGGDLEENQSRVFKLKWLHQLTGVVDDLNLKYGIAHQDITARNLLVDDVTDSLMLCDFNYSARIGTLTHSEHKNDIKGVIFTMNEIITCNKGLRDVPCIDQDLAAIEEQEEWPKHPDVMLDHPVSEYRSALKEWSQKRQQGEQVNIYTDAPEYIDWPDMAEPPLTMFESEDMYGNKTPWVCYDKGRTTTREEGGIVLNWEQLSQNKLKDRALRLATSEIIDTHLR